MLHIKTEDGIRTLKKLGVQISPDKLAVAQARAINHSLSKGRSIARKEVKTVYNISQRSLEGINFHRANKSKLHGELFASKKPIPLDAFAPKQLTATRTITITKRGEQKVKELKRVRTTETGGVVVEVVKGKPKIIEHAFMIPGGKAKVFARGEYKRAPGYGFIYRHHRVNKDGSDTPVRPLVSLSTFGSVINDKVLTRIGRQVKGFYKDRVVHEINVIANGWERELKK